MLLARYLIEDNNDYYVELDINKTSNLKMIESVFKSLVKPYKLFKENEETKINLEIKEIFKEKEKEMILENAFASLIYEKNQEFCTSKTIEDAFLIMNIDITPAQLEYIIMKLFEISNNINNLPFKQILPLFGSTKKSKKSSIDEISGKKNILSIQENNENILNNNILHDNL